MKPNDNQLEVIEFLMTQLKYWKGTNDISSPTHRGDITEEVIKLDNITSEERAKLDIETGSLLRLIQSLGGKK